MDPKRSTDKLTYVFSIDKLSAAQDVVVTNVVAVKGFTETPTV